MEKFGTKKPNTSSKPVADNVVDIAIARMKSGAVVREERKKRIKFVLFAALGITGLAAFSTLDFERWHHDHYLLIESLVI